MLKDSESFDLVVAEQIGEDALTVVQDNAQDLSPTLIRQNAQVMELEEALPALETAQLSPISLNAEHWDPTIGEIKRFVYMGWDFLELPDINEPEKRVMVRVVYLFRLEGQKVRQYFTAATQLVNDLSRQYPKTAWEIEYLGEAKTKTNATKKYKRFNVTALQYAK